MRNEEREEGERERVGNEKTEGREVKTAVRLFTPQMKPTEELVARMESS